MRILQYNNLNNTGLRQAFDRTVAQLEAGDFRAADVKKLNPGPFYRAKLSDADRLIFRFGDWRGETCLILLEIVRNHAYATSRFLRGAVVDETKLIPVTRAEPLLPEDRLSLAYVNSARPHVHLLDKILSFDEEQENALTQIPPLILIGSAGSGKTVLSIEKLRQLPGEVLYVTHSPFLVDNARSLYYAHHYENDAQEVDFLSFLEFVQSIAVPPGRPLTFADFAAWISRARGGVPVRDTNALYEEFNGVLSGSSPSQPYLTREEYLSLGVRRSIFAAELRPAIYDLFRRYLDFLPASGCYDLNLVCHGHHTRCRPAYDFLVVDEVQDMTAVQLSLALQALRRPSQFVLCGDSNQIVHPNFFSWAGVKTFFHERHGESHTELTRILNINYRNSPAVTEVANRLLRIKQARFGSIDRESHYLIQPFNDRPGGVTFLEDTEAVRRDLDRKTARSTRFAVIVLREEDKAEAQRSFRTPLVFSVREAKGLEYDHIILPSLISSQPTPFREIAAGVSETALDADFTYRRARDKSDHSLDAYKFFVNSFYVALTRAISHVYILERDTNHPLLRLLRLRTGAATELTEQHSSEAEWREEALRLERQGKHDQVEAIRRTILHVEPVPWPVLTPAAAETLAHDVLAPSRADPKAQRLLLDYAATYTVPHLLRALAESGYKPAAQPEIARNAARQRYGVDYHQNGYRDLLRKTEQHGIDFRNPLNQTPLMLAVQFGLDPLVGQLIERGANLTLADNWGRIPLHIALRAAYQNPLYAKHTLAKLYPPLCPPVTNVRIGRRLVQVDNHRMAFFLLHSMLAQLEMILRSKILSDVPGFETSDFIEALASFPDSVIPARRRTRPAISAALAGNEVFREAPRNRRLFVRIRRGYYLPNPCMELEQNGEWINVLDLFHIDDLEREADNTRLTHFLAYIRGLQKNLAAVLDVPSGDEPAATVPLKASDKTPERKLDASTASASGGRPERKPADAVTVPVSGTLPERKPQGAAVSAGGEAVEHQPTAMAVTAPDGGDGRSAEAEQLASTPSSEPCPETGRQRTLNVDDATRVSPASVDCPLLLPDHAVLTRPPAPLTASDPSSTAQADIHRQKRTRYLLGHNANLHLNDLCWLSRVPREGATCLLDYLEEMQASPSKPIKSSKLDGFRLALLLLATWRETRAYRPALRLLARRGFEQWIGTKGANIDMLAAIVAHLCDGDLAPLRDLIVTQKASIFGRLVAAAVVPQLTLRHGLAADINREFLRSLLTPTVIERLEGRQKFAIIERAAIDACHFHPVELRAELMAAVRSGIVERHVLTLKQIAETAALPAWERAQLVNEHYVRLPADVWAFLKAQQRTLSTDEDQDDEDDAEWESTLPISPNRNYGMNADSGLDGTFPSGQNIRPDPASLPFGDTPSREVKKVGRNDPCPCGSGKKHKKCCGA